MFPEIPFIEKKRFHRDELLSQKNDVDHAESFIFQLYQHDSLFDLLLIIFDSNDSLQWYRSFLIKHADSYLNYFNFVIESKFIEDESIALSEFMTKATELFRKFIDAGHHIDNVATRVSVTQEVHDSFRNCLSVYPTPKSRTALFIAIQTIRIQITRGLTYSTVRDFMLTKFYFNWRSELRSRIFGLCLRQLQEICEHLEQGELSAFNLESTLDIPVGSNQNSLPTAASSCTTGSHINNNEKALLSIRDKLGSSCESFASTNGSPFLDANPTKIMPHVWSVESATKDFCLHINVNVLNKFVSNDNNWVLVLLSHIENSCMAFSLHCAPASGGQIRRNKAVAKHPIVYANKALARMYGFSRNELQGKPIDFAVSPVIPGTSSQKDRFSMNRSAKVQPTSPTAPTTTTNTTFTTTNTATTTGTSGSVRMNSSSSSSISGGSGSSLSSTPAVAGIVGGRNAIAEERATLLSFDMEQLLLQELQEVPSARVSLQGGGDDGDGLHGILTTLNDDSYRSNSTNQSKSVPLTHPEISSSENSISNSQPKFFLSVDPTIGSSSKDSCKEETPTGGTARDSINSSVLSLGASYLESSSSSKSRSAAATQAQVDTFTTKMESMRPSQVLFLRYRILRPRTQQEHNHISMCSYSQQPGEHVDMHVNSQASQQQTRKYIDSNSHSSGSGGGGGGDIVGSSYTHGSNCGASHAGDLPDYSACPSHNSGASSNPQQQHQNGTSYNELHSLPMAESFYATILVAVKGLFSSDNQQSLQYHVAIYSEILPTDDIADKCSTMEQLLLLLPNNVQNESVDEPILPDKSNAIRRVRDFITAKLG